MEKYYIVDSAILPDVLDKVIEARSLLQNGEVKQVSEAVKRVGISRGTYYKYKDYVFLPDKGMSARKAVISLMLHHDKGILSEVLNVMSKTNANILTINQNIQYYLEKNLRETLEEHQCKGAYGIVMNCNTGAVLAMASLPDYDCNEPYKITYNKGYKKD